MSNPIVSFDEQAVKDELRELVRKTIEETINAMLDEEADQLVGAGPYERTDERAAYRAGHYERGFTTTSGQVTLKMSKLKGMRFATAVIERCKRRETSVEEAIIEMYLAGVFTRCIEDGNEILWGAGVSAGAVSSLDDKGFKAVEEWTCRPLACEYPYVCVDGIYLKRSWGASCENVAVMVAISVNEDGCREAIGCAETLAHCEMPREHWRRIRTSNAIERLNREIRRRARVVGTFPDGKSALVLAAARLKYVADSEWGSRRYLGVSLLKEQSCRRLAEFAQNY